MITKPGRLILAQWQEHAHFGTLDSTNDQTFVLEYAFAVINGRSILAQVVSDDEQSQSIGEFASWISGNGIRREHETSSHSPERTNERDMEKGETAEQKRASLH